MPTPLITSKAKVHQMHPCGPRWSVFCAARSGIKEDAPITLESILDTNGEDDARWVLARMGQPGHVALVAFSSWCALQEQPSPREDVEG